MLASVVAAFRIPDLKRRITFLFGMFAVYVIGLHISVPGVDTAILSERLSGGLFDILNAFTGGAFKKYTIFAMGIMPYINASIIMQLLTIAIPQLEEMQKEGAAGQKRIRLYTRWLTGVLALFQAYGTTTWLRSMGAIQSRGGIFDPVIIQIAITLVAGTAFLMWLGEQISDKGIGNGVSIVIFAGIVAVLPAQVFQTLAVVWTNGDWLSLVMLAVLFVGTVAFMIAVTQAQRKIPIQHVKRVVGNRMVGGQSSFLPLKVNSAGVIPIIFAVSIQYFPMTVANILTKGDPNHWMTKLAHGLVPGTDWHFGGQGGTVYGAIIYAAMIIFFTYFYTAVTVNVKDLADNLKKWGSFIPGIRPGKPTQDYLDRIMTRITLSGAIFLAIVALLQYYVPQLTGIHTFSLVGGTSLLIVVGVALETMQAIESHLLMRHYEGFIK
ncbi:MAG: preprotein translocase subunit SecY [Armatimonadota bacterium]